MDKDSYICQRKVCLARNGDPAQATEACAVLQGIKGVYQAEPLSKDMLALSYSIKYLSFDLIEALLKELGFYLNDSIPAMLRRTVYQYLENNLREKLHVDEQTRGLACGVESPMPGEEPEKYWNNYH